MTLNKMDVIQKQLDAIVVSVFLTFEIGSNGESEGREPSQVGGTGDAPSDNGSALAILSWPKRKPSKQSKQFSQERSLLDHNRFL